jgi:ankyrin repeat protein
MKPLFRLLVFGCIANLCWMGCGPKAPKTTLHQAAESGNLWAVQKHITAKTDLNKKNTAGWTALHLAVMKGDLEIVKALCEAGADITIKGNNDKTPFDLAREGRQTAIAKFLQEHAPGQAGSGNAPGRRLIDGGLGVGEVLDSGL